MTADASPTAIAPTLDALSVVIPVFNERDWIRVSVAALFEAARNADIRVDVVVVDDGSTDGTSDILDEMAGETGIRVCHQANTGRFAARAAGLAQAQEPWVMLLDSRVTLEPAGLAWLRNHLVEHPDRRAWCGHVDVETVGSIYAGFWSGLVKVGWRRYMAHPRLVSFGSEEFDYYPKGTTCFFMERAALQAAIGGFESMYGDPKLSSDDTRLLRDVAGNQRIWLSPDFRCTYHAKSGARGFVRQSYFRGTTFVDGYLGQPGPLRRALVAAIGALPVLALVALRRPKIGASAVAVGLAAVPAAVRLSGGTSDEVRAAALLTPVFVPLFGAGVLRGLALAAVARRRGRRRPTRP